MALGPALSLAELREVPARRGRLSPSTAFHLMEFRTPAPVRPQKNTFPLPQLESSIPWAPGRSHLPSCTPSVRPTPSCPLVHFAQRGSYFSHPPFGGAERDTEHPADLPMSLSPMEDRAGPEPLLFPPQAEGVLSQGEAKCLPLPVPE